MEELDMLYEACKAKIEREDQLAKYHQAVVDQQANQINRMAADYAQHVLDLEVWALVGWVVWGITVAGFFFWRYVL